MKYYSLETTSFLYIPLHIFFGDTRHHLLDDSDTCRNHSSPTVGYLRHLSEPLVTTCWMIPTPVGTTRHHLLDTFDT